MAKVAFGEGFWIGASMDHQGPTISSGTYRIDATGEYSALIFRAPKDGDLDRFDFNVATVTNSPDNGLVAGFEGVDGSGLPDGTYLGATANAKTTYAHTLTTGWKSTNFGEVATVTRGQLIAATLRIPSFTASDDVTFSHSTYGTHSFPYGVTNGTKQATNLPIFIPHYDSGYEYIASWLPGASASGAFAYNASFGEDEVGIAFSLPFDCTITKIFWSGERNAGGSYHLYQYDAASTLLSDQTIDMDHFQSASAQSSEIVLDDPLLVTANQLYRITARELAGTHNLGLNYYTMASAALMDTMPLGQNGYCTSRVNGAGAWTDYNSGTIRVPRIALFVSEIEHQPSSGGAHVVGG